MQLSQLTLNGFKSFGDPVTVEFVPGINAIVGPNGSGKSNIIDGLRWATGGGRASSYRAGSKTDLIFHGASGKKSLSFAEVEIELKSVRGDIKIARRMLRDGSIKLRLNGKASKFKEVYEVLSGSGLGRGNLAIIGQGEVSTVLTAGPDRLLSYVAEAANVAILSQRRDQANSRLETAREHLIRLADIMHTLEAQLESLREEAKEAERFNALSKEELELKYSISVKRVEGLETELEDLQKQEKSLDQRLEQNRNKLSQTQIDWQNLRQELKILEADYRQALTEAEAKRGDLRVAQERLNAAQERIEGIRKTKTQSELEIQRLKELKEPEPVEENLEAMLEQKHLQLAELERLQTQSQELEIELEKLRQTLEHTKAEIAKEEQAKANYYFKKEQLEEQYKSLELRLGQIAKGTNAELENLIKEVRQLEDEYNAASTKYEELREQLTDKMREHAEAHAQAAALSQTAKRARAAFEARRGYAQGPKIALSSGINGIYGSVADLIEVKAEYRQAIAAALGRRAEYIVVDTANTAQKLIAYVKKAGAWVTVLPLELIKAQTPSLSPQIAKQAGVIDLATNLLNCDAKFQTLINQLLGRTAVIDTMDNAVKIAKSFSSRPRLVTIDGNILESYGAMSGGKSRMSASVIGAAAELEDAEAKAQTAQVKTQKLLSELESLQTEAKSSRNRLEAAKKALSSKQAKLSKLREEYNVSNSLNDVLGKQLIDIREQLMALVEPVAMVDREEYRQEQEKYRALEQRFQEISDLVKVKKDEYQEIREKYLVLQQRQERYSEDLNRYVLEQKRLKELENQYSDLIEQEKQAEENLIKAKLRHKDALEAIPKDLDEKKQRYEKANIDSQNAEKLLAELNQIQSDLAQKLEDVRLKQARRETALEIAKEELAKFPAGIKLLEESMRSCRSRLNYVQTELENIGPVNHRASQDLLEKQQNHDDLEVEIVQATLAVSELEAALEKIDKETNTRIEAATQALQIKFKEYVRELFGQEAQSEINIHREEERITGLSIDLQPPGKKTKSLNLLSVGERTMGAMAFLFSLMQSDGGHGLPIAILDEVDAPLDEANIRRYTKFVQFMAAKGTQFVLITHQKATFDVADVLWGVTSDQGVSRVFSISKKDHVFDE